MRKLLIAIAASFAPILSVVAATPTISIAAEQSAPIAAGDLTITAYRAKMMLPNQPTGGGFLTIANKGATPDRLLAVTSPSAGMVEIHTMEIVNDVMTMRPVEGGLEIPAGATIELKPGGVHLMFMHVAEPFKQGASVPLTLEFEHAGKIDLTLPVVGLGG